MRGEEKQGEGIGSKLMELPPHARRRVVIGACHADVIGITSACAEKRTPPQNRSGFRWNYLRMRGEEPVKILVSWPL